MKTTKRFSDAIHVLSYIGLRGDIKITSKIMADSVQVNPVTIRQITSLLRKAKLIETSQGSTDIKLSRDPKTISLLDIYDAVMDEKLLNPDTDTNPTCPIGRTIPSVLDRHFQRVENAARSELQEINLAGVMNEIIRTNIEE